MFQNLPKLRPKQKYPKMLLVKYIENILMFIKRIDYISKVDFYHLSVF